MGVMAEQADWNDGFISLFIITFIGLGFVGAFFISRKFEKEDEALAMTVNQNERIRNVNSFIIIDCHHE